MFFRKDPLEGALARAGDRSFDLEAALRDLPSCALTTAGQARQVVGVLQQAVPAQDVFWAERIALVVPLCQEIKTRAAGEVIYDAGLPEMIRLADALSQALAVRPGESSSYRALTCLFTALATIPSEEGLACLVRIARRPQSLRGHDWILVLIRFGRPRPLVAEFFAALTDPLPESPLLEPFVDAANCFARHAEGFEHPLRTEAGRRWLARSLADTSPMSSASVAVDTIAYLPIDQRKPLIQAAFRHPSPTVAFRGAIEAARLGSRTGRERLIEACRDVRNSQAVCQSLREVGLEACIPAEVADPSFQARAAFSHWLSYPTELGCPPDDVTIRDHRVLAWPPAGVRLPLWVLDYHLTRDDGRVERGTGLVGHITFCLFGYDNHLRTPEEVYAIHCGWELTFQQRIESIELIDAEQIVPILLRQWTKSPLEAVELKSLVRISPDVGYPQAKVAIVQARWQGQSGHAVLDGPRSAWYPNTAEVCRPPDQAVLSLHIGRVLLTRA